MQAHGGAFKGVDPHLAGNLLDGVAAVLGAVGTITNVPVFGACAQGLRAVYTVAKDFRENKELVVRLASRCALLVEAIAHRMDPGSTDLREPLRKHAVDFTKFLVEVAHFLETVKSKPKWYRILNSSVTRKEIEEFDLRLQTMVKDFQLAAVLNLDRWAAENNADRNIAENAAQDMLEQLQKNDATLLATLELGNAQIMEVLRTIQAAITTGDATPREQILLRKTRASLSRLSGEDLTEEDWHIPESDIVLEGDSFASGGFGEVFKATWSGTRTVALKRLLVRNPSQKLTDLLYNEVKRWSQLRHPNILQLFGANLIATQPFMVSPYMQHGHLLSYLQKYPHINRVHLVFDVASAMQYLHGKGILHRDLKAANVLVDNLGNALVTDFGFAAVTKQVSNLTGLARVGTKRWMAPELFATKPTLTEKLDVYAFAMTVYEMYTLQMPFAGVADDAVVTVMKSGERPDIETYEDLRDVEEIDDAELAATVPMPKPIQDLVRRCWDPQLGKRPTFATLISELKRAYPDLNNPSPPSRLLSIQGRSHDSGVTLSPSQSQYALSPSRTPSAKPSTERTMFAEAEHAIIEKATEARLRAQFEAEQSELRERLAVLEKQAEETRRLKVDEESRLLKAQEAEQKRQIPGPKQNARVVRTPRQLTADEKKLGKKVQDALLQLYNGNPTELDLRSNSIGEAGARAVADALKTNSTLTLLNLDWNEIGEAGARAVANALKTNTTLTSLDLRHNEIGEAGARAVADALKTNTTLTSLDLH
ncbi:hypothetical protein HDU93_007652, partial [Gonapodya sp. JEL0774]